MGPSSLRLIFFLRWRLRLQFLWHRQRSIIRHGFQVPLRCHLATLLYHAAQQLEVVDVERRSVGIEESGFLVKGIAERVGCADRDGEEVVQSAVYVGLVRDVETDSAFCCEEHFIVHLGFVRSGGLVGGRDNVPRANELVDPLFVVGA